MFSSMAESCSTALHRPSARCLSTWVSHLLTPRHCLFCYWCFFVHCEDKLQVLGCISASFVRSQMNKTMITSMHLMHWFTNERSEAQFSAVTSDHRLGQGRIEIVTILMTGCHARVTCDKPLSCYFRIRSCPLHQKLILAIWMHTIFFVEKQYNTMKLYFHLKAKGTIAS